MTILDFSRAVAGAYTTRLLADMGARVIKVEEPGIGDQVRYVGIDHPEIGDCMLPTFSPMFIMANAGKESLCLDLRVAEARDLIRRLLEKIDIVVENYTRPAVRKWGIGYEEFRKIRPDLVMCSITGYGLEGPLADHVCNDAVAQAMGGMAALAGEKDGYPVMAGNTIADSATATTAAMATLAAVLHRARTGEGQHVDVSIVDTVMALDSVAHPAVAASRGAFRPRRDLKTHFMMSPWGVFKGPEGRYFAMLGNWERLVEFMDRPELLEDPELATNSARLRNRERVHAIVEEFLQSFESAEAAFRAFVDAKVPAGPVLEPFETQRHEQFVGRHMVHEVPYTDQVSIPTVASAPHFSRTPISVGRAPFIGEHNRDICRGLLGLGEDELDLLHELGALQEDDALRLLFEGAPT